MCSFVGCESATQPTEGKFTISGNTYYIGSPAPVGGVLIKCAGVSTTSGADGSYQLSGLSGGTQIITAERSDCDGYTDTIDVKADSKLYIFLKLSTTQLTGIVSNVIDGPVVGATVVVAGITATTDNSGRYEIPEAPRGIDSLYVTQPDYIAFKAAVSLTTSEQQYNVVLSRQRVIQGTVTEDAFVTERYPYENIFGYSLLVLSADGAGIPANNQDNIYIKFSFPSFFSDYRVTVLSAKLELCMNTNTSLSSYRTYAVGSMWTGSTITYSTQPTTDSLLSAGTFGDGSLGKYWSFLGTTGVNTVLARWRANIPVYGIVIEGGSPNGSAAYFYSLESNSPPPRITFTVLY